MDNGITNITVDSGYDASKVVRSLKRIQGVGDIYEVTGSYDIIAMVYGRNKSALNSTLDSVKKIPGISMSTQIVLKKYKQRA